MGKMGGGGFETLPNNKNKETNIKNKFFFKFFINFLLFFKLQNIFMAYTKFDISG